MNGNPRAVTPVLTNSAGSGAGVAPLVRDVLEAYFAAGLGDITAGKITATLTARDLEQLGGAIASEAAIEAALREGAGEGRLLAVRGTYIDVQAIRADGGEVFGDVLVAIARAAATAARAVRFGEILPYVTGDEGEHDAASRERLTRAIRSLLRVGALRTVATVRGESASGKYLLVPRRMAPKPEAWLPPEPLTFLEYVTAHIRALVAERHATFTSDELRTRLRADVVGGLSVARTRYGVALDEPMTVILALQKLAAGAEPLLTKVSGRRACWRLVASSATPHDNGEHPVEGTEAVPAQRSLTVYACDTDRIIAAAQRAVMRLSAHAITAEDVQAEVSLDPALRPVGRARVAALLSDIVRDSIDNGDGRRAARQGRPIRRLGTRAGRAVYWVAMPAGTSEVEGMRIGASSFEDEQRRFRTNRVRTAFGDGRFHERAGCISQALSPAVAYGRARQLESELAPLYDQAREAQRDASRMASGEGEMSADATTTLQQIEEMLQTVGGWWRFRAHDAASALSDIRPPRVYSAAAVQDLFAPYSATAAALTTDGEVKARYWRAIRRVANPAFANRRAASRDEAHEYYFDACDAQLYLATQWGGPYALLMTMEAREELGDLRDARYLVAGLDAPDARTRRRLLGGLAFLGDPDTVGVVELRARSDVDASVRECALWALGMLRGEAADPVLREAAESDPSRAVRTSAARFRRTGAHWWFRV